MLIGKLNLTRCSSTIYAPARLRIPQFNRSYHEIESHLPIGSNRRTPSPRYRPALDHKSNDRNNSCSATVARLSTTSSSYGKIRQHNAPVLKPRGKPKFRRTTKEEYDEIVQALRDAQKNYDAQSMQEEDVDQKQIERGLSNGEPAAFVDPFFATSDLHQSDLSLRRVAPIEPNESDKLPKFQRLSRSQTSTADLEEELYYLAHNNPHPVAIHNILKILICNRQIQPIAEYYEALILANTWPEYGSLDNVEKIIQEMDVEGIEMGQNIIAAVLKVLAIHPSPELSHRMLTLVQRRWLVLTPQTQNHLALSMIRTGQTELAAWELDHLRTIRNVAGQREKEIVPDYLTVLLIVQLQEMGDWEGILRYFYKLRNRRAADRDIPIAFWSWLLDRASKVARTVSEAALQSNEPPTRTSNPSNQTLTPSIRAQLTLSNPAFTLISDLWIYYVANMSLRPNWDTCLSILHSAANTGTPWLASSVTTTMTYLDGIDDRGNPKIHLDASITTLVETAKRRAKHNADRESEEVKSARAAAENTRREKAKLKKDVDEWYAKLMARFDEEKTGARGGETEKETTRTNEKKRSDPTHHNTTNHQDKKPTSPTTQSEIETTTTPATEKDYTVFDPTSVPIDNLWPLFPKLGGWDSAHVDPWDSLGPRSSSRRQWTEAQKHYKAVERAQRGNKNKPRS